MFLTILLRLDNNFSMMGFISYYGHVQNTSNLGENIFKSHLFGALVEVRSRVVITVNNKSDLYPSIADTSLECSFPYQQVWKKNLFDFVFPTFYNIQLGIWPHLSRFRQSQTWIRINGTNDHRSGVFRLSSVRKWTDTNGSERKGRSTMWGCWGCGNHTFTWHSLLGKNNPYISFALLSSCEKRKDFYDLITFGSHMYEYFFWLI